MFKKSLIGILVCLGSITPSMSLLLSESAYAFTKDNSNKQFSTIANINQGKRLLLASNNLNNNDISIESTIAHKWIGGYKVEINVSPTTALGVNDWQTSFSLPSGYEVREIFGMEVSGSNENLTLSGVHYNSSLSPGQTAKGVLIIDGPSTVALEFNSGTSSSVASTSDTSLNDISIESNITTEWSGGYRVEINVTAPSEVYNWQTSFSLPSGYKVREIYGMEVSGSNENLTLSGVHYNSSLSPGQTAIGVLIIDGPSTVALEFNSGTSSSVASTPVTEPTSTSTPVATVTTPAPTTNPSSVPIPQESDYNFGNGSNSSATGKFNYGEVLQKNFLFYEANRGGRLPASNRLEWRSDATVSDGSDVGRDLSGGYYDAGDHVIFGQPFAFSNTLLAWSGIDYRDAYIQSGQYDELLRTVKWGTDWFLKAHEVDSSGKTLKLYVQVGDGSDHHYWVNPEKIHTKTGRPSFALDRNKPGSDVAGGVASAFASASMLFRGVDDAYANKLLVNAKQVYEFAETYQGKYSDSIPQANPFYTSHGYKDELVEGAIWLYKATGEKKYLTKAEDYFRNNIGGLGDWTYAADDHSYAAAALLAKESSDSSFKSIVENWLNIWVEGRYGVKYTQGGFAHRNNWASAPLAVSTAFIAEWYSDNVRRDQNYSNFATKQLNYVLGDNPRGYSYVVGFGNNYPKRSHHRGSAYPVNLNGSAEENTHILYGALVGGLGQPNDFSHNDRRDDWVTNEVGISYNAPLAGAAIQQYENYGGNPLSDGQLNALEGVNAYGTGNVNARK